jgi:hypothetical protein
MVAGAFGKIKSPGKKKLPNAPQFLEKPEFSYHDLKQRGTTPGPSHPELRGRGMMEETRPQNIKAKRVKPSLDPAKHDSSRLKYFGDKGA